MNIRAHRFLFALLTGALVVGISAARADDVEAVKDKLFQAKKDYDAQLQKFKKAITETLDKHEEDARKAGNKKIVDQIKTEREAFEKSGELPPILPTTTRDIAIAARTKLDKAYTIAAKEYLRLKMDDAVEATEKERKEFLVISSQLLGKKHLEDLYPVGTFLTGQLKWSGDPGNHNYLIVITERSGTSFKGIARLDYGPSGDPKRKTIYDIEGEANGLNFKYKGDLGGLNEVEGKWVKDGIQISASAANGGTLSGTLQLKKP
ncbi:MAG TPA: hypothetical protein VG122_15595 [Gemmata sp.]|jgi:hypothetical protein|nr:hypothetical protein [Gemmata sp.]